MLSVMLYETLIDINSSIIIVYH